MQLLYQETVEEICLKSESFESKQSGFTLTKVLYLDLYFNKYNPMRASSFINNIKKQGIVNVQNLNDQACFAWSVLSALCKPTGDARLTSSYPNYETTNLVNFNRLKFPLK